MKRRTDSQLIHRAMNLAIEYELTFIDAIKGCDNESDNDARQYAEQFIKEARAYLKRKYAPKASLFENAEAVSIEELMKNPEKYGIENSYKESP